MNSNPISESEIVATIVFSCLAFVLMGVVLVMFFYFSRKKIIKEKLEKKDLEIQYQKDQVQAVILTQEEERKRIAQDLHDDISSKLNVVSLNSHLLNTPNLSESEINEITGNIINLTAKALDSSRKIAHGLFPPVLEKFGLHAGIEELCLEFESSKAISIDYQNHIDFDKKDKDKHLHIFRILQELMNNSLRHGKATKISIVFEENDGIKKGTYSDNGIGFDSKNIENQKGLGMKNIESRVSFLNGNLDVESVINRGISVVFTF
ncbi:sensor histidine kinase [Flavobacterium hydatis]|jgi:signal transduction histidine kinase|uniref:histidine kinase n=1 Tax=Flavobacterium hydatis TaxID=991 RepID=A0A086AG66_FLAHY|nr:histidine kinase [Flavobacterium hydatis]KFF15680.1 histidine kinase [Flavobacterium hydatis]OXA86571.1 two-component sensor histidine kinase [Flavobacterium hydatis]